MLCPRTPIFLQWAARVLILAAFIVVGAILAFHFLGIPSCSQKLVDNNAVIIIVRFDARLPITRRTPIFTGCPVMPLSIKSIHRAD